MNGMEKRNDMSKLKWTIKLIIIVAGSVVAAYGITLALYAGFGGATLAVLWQGISKTFHVSIGYGIPSNRTPNCCSVIVDEPEAIAV